jgi:hypothetical protein
MQVLGTGTTGNGYTCGSSRVGRDLDLRVRVGSGKGLLAYGSGRVAKIVYPQTPNWYPVKTTQ